MNGLINFLDHVGDWAESEGFFQYPNLENPEQEANQPTLRREDVIGREFYISSTAHFQGELFVSQRSRCDGASESCDRLRFTSDVDNHTHMNLGAAPERSREHVFMSQKDIFNYLKRQLSDLSEKKPYARAYPYLLLDEGFGNGRFAVHFAKPVHDPWTGNFHLEGPKEGGFQTKVNLPENFRKNESYVSKNRIYRVFDRGDLEGLSKALADDMRPYLLEPTRGKGLDQLISKAKEKQQGKPAPVQTLQKGKMDRGID